VLLAEDQTMLRGALASLLDLEPDITIVAQAANGREAISWPANSAPDVVVTDIEMPQMTGLEFAAALQQAESKTRVIILTTFARPGYLRRALDAGARGYLLKERPASELAEAIRKVHAGLRAVDPALAAEAWSADADPLTDRERQILQRAGDGRSSAEIAAELRLSEGTVRNYLSEAIAKLGAANRTDAARIADGCSFRRAAQRHKLAEWLVAAPLLRNSPIQRPGFVGFPRLNCICIWRARSPRRRWWSSRAQTTRSR
jgi:two-component system response regulator DesR